ncbi:MAG: GntR family transcriptional regulator [Beutenbergiaceae bacterium]
MVSTDGTEHRFLALSPDSGARHRTLADQVAADLQLAILQGEYAGGSHLRIQDLAERFETSPMPVREALRKLAGLGLVEILPHRGARVLELSLADLEDTYRTRMALECLTISEAARRITADQGEAAAAALARHEQLLDSGHTEEARNAHTEYHFLLYSAAGSKWLLRAIEPVWRNNDRYRFALSHDADDRAHSHLEHVRILEACLAHDPEAADAAMRDHLAGAMSRMRASMNRSTRSGT